MVKIIEIESVAAFAEVFLFPRKNIYDEGEDINRRLFGTCPVIFVLDVLKKWEKSWAKCIGLEGIEMNEPQLTCFSFPVIIDLFQYLGKELV